MDPTERVDIVRHSDGYIARTPYKESFIDALKQWIPQDALRWMEHLRWADRGWWFREEYLPTVEFLLASFFPTAAALREPLAALAVPAVPVYESPPEGCDRFSGFLTKDEINTFIGTIGVVLHRPILPLPDAALDTADEDFWDTGYGLDLVEQYGRPNDVRWFNEIFAVLPGAAVVYAADRSRSLGPWLSRVAMTREQARLMGRVRTITCRRLQDLPLTDYGVDEQADEDLIAAARASFLSTWDRRKLGKNFPSTGNPWVWRVEIERVLPRT